MPTTVNGDVYFTNTGGVSFGFNGISVSGSAPAAGAAATLMQYQVMPNVPNYTTNLASADKSLTLMPFTPCDPFPGVMTASTFMIGVVGFASQSTASGSINFSFGIYTLNNSTLSILNSASTRLTYDAVSDNSTAFSGARWLTIHSSQWSVAPSFSQTNYWLGCIMESSNATQLIDVIGNLRVGRNIARFGTLGANLSTNATYLQHPFCGWYSATTGAFPVSIGSNEVTSNGAPNGPFLPVVLLNNAVSVF